MRESIMLDSHIHLDADQYADVAALIKRARDAGVNGVVAVGITPASNRRVLELAHAYPDFVHAAIGFHPERFDLTDDDVDTTLAMIGDNREKICAIGEVGLPYYGDHGAPRRRPRACAQDPRRALRDSRLNSTSR